MAKTEPRQLFHRAHYNIIAKQFRELLKESFGFYGYFNNPLDTGKPIYYANEALLKLAISMAKRFVEDNPNFDPIKFLNACSPDLDKYPLGELWQTTTP